MTAPAVPLSRRECFQAYVAGERAALDGHPESACPYGDDPDATEQEKFSRAGWLEGYRQV